MALQKRYRPALENKIDQLWHQGYCVFERWELAAWFDRERITNIVWREIQEYWEDSFELPEDQKALKVIKCDLTTTPQTFVVIQASRAIDMADLAS